MAKVEGRKNLTRGYGIARYRLPCLSPHTIHVITLLPPEIGDTLPALEPRSAMKGCPVYPKVAKRQ
jgi:hypothetical protein